MLSVIYAVSQIMSFMLNVVKLSVFKLNVVAQGQGGQPYSDFPLWKGFLVVSLYPSTSLSKNATHFEVTFRRGCKINVLPGNTKGGSITVPLTSCLTRLD